MPVFRIVLVVLAHVGLTPAADDDSASSDQGRDLLAPTFCDNDVVAYVQQATSWGSSTGRPAGGRLSSCACLLDSRSGFTPLHEVANRGGLRAGGVIGVLVTAYADVLEVDLRGATALHVAAMRGEFPAAAALVAAAARNRYKTNLLIARDEDGKTAVDLADEGGHVAVARYLVQQGGIRGERLLGWNECAWPLADSVLLGNIDSFLAEVGKFDFGVRWKKPTVNSSRGSTNADCFYPPTSEERSLLHVALAIAALQSPPGGLDITQGILARGGNASRADAAGDLPLNRAGRADRVDLVNALLAAMPAGAVDAKDSKGRTALIEASRTGARNAASTLMMGGASVDVRDSSGLTALEYAEREGYEDVASAIEIAVRLPPSQMSKPGAFYNSQDYFEPPPAEEEESTDIIPIVFIAVGVFLGIVSLLLIVWGTRVFQKRLYHVQNDSDIVSLPSEDGPEETRESLRKAIEQGPSKKERRESSKKKDKKDKGAEPKTSSLVPPGQIRSDSSEGDGHTPPRRRRPPIVTMQVPGQQTRGSRHELGQQTRAVLGPSSGLGSLSPAPLSEHALSDADLSPKSIAKPPRGKPPMDGDSAPPPPSPSADSQGQRSRIMCAAAAQAAGKPELPMLQTKSSEKEMTPAERAVMLAKEVTAKSQRRWANTASGRALPRSISASAISSNSGTSSADSSPRESARKGIRQGVRSPTRASAKERREPPSSSALSTASSTAHSSSLRSAGRPSRESPALPADVQLPAALRGPAAPLDAQLPAALRSTSEGSARRSAGNQADKEHQGSTKTLPKARPKAKSPAKQSVL